MLVDAYNVSSHSFTQGSYKLIYGELSLPLVIKEVQVVEFRDFQVSTSSLAGVIAGLRYWGPFPSLSSLIFWVS